MKSNLITKSFVISEENISTIKEFGEKNELNDSAVLRLIINQWSEMRKEYITVPIKGTVK